MNARYVQHPARALAGILALTASVAVAAGASADFETQRVRTSRSHWNADGSLVDVQVRVQGETVPLYFRPGTFDRHYFQANRGRNYSLVVRNTTGERIGVLIAVDGLNVVNGERSRLGRNETMYVLDPWETATVSGWRTSLQEVRKFVFVDEERSYAERTGQANGDLGWIRVLAFREKHPQLGWGQIRGDRHPRDYRNPEEGSGAREEMAPAPQSTAPPTGGNEAGKSVGDARSQRQYLGSESDANPGTGWGERRHDPVRETEFNAARSATDHLVMRYEYLPGLQTIGIFPQRNRLWDRERGQLGFSRPPGR